MLAYAQQADVGPVTGLAMPRFVSLKSATANVRRGPSLNHRVDWIFQHRGTPLQVTAEFENWRRIRDVDGAGGWVHYTLLSGVRTVLVTQDDAPIFDQPRSTATVVARAERGVIGRLLQAQDGWCEISADGTAGWIDAANVWGLVPGEIID